MDYTYIVQYFESGTDPNKTMVSAAVEAGNALLAIERANERLQDLPKKMKWLVHAVGLAVPLNQTQEPESFHQH